MKKARVLQLFQPCLLLWNLLACGVLVANGFDVPGVQRSALSHVSQRRHAGESQKSNEQRLVSNRSPFTLASAKQSAVGANSARRAYQGFDMALKGGAIAPDVEKTKVIGAKSDAEKSIGRELVAEFLGTYLIIQLGCGVVCTSKYFPASAHSLFSVAVIWGFAITASIYSFTGISGAHFNPAITLAMTIFRGAKNAWNKVIPFMVAQLGGAVAASYVNHKIFSSSMDALAASMQLKRGMPGCTSVLGGAYGMYFGGVVSTSTALALEILGTSILSFVVFSLTNDRNKEVPKKAVPPLVGMTVACLVCIMAPLTQAGFNPARDFGPRLVTWFFGWGRAASFQGWWVYTLGPVVGALLGAFVAEEIVWKSPEK